MELVDWETQRVNKEISALKAAKKPVPDDLVDRPMLLENQGNLLVVMVQKGKLTPEMYGEHLGKLVEGDKELLEVLKSAKLDKEAKMVAERIKVLQAEIQSMNEAEE